MSIFDKFCYHYNNGGDESKGRAYYPTEYGVRCEYWDKFIDNCTDCVLNHIVESKKENDE